ncbi:MAG TPA: hypothetical protein VMW75_25455, partial [Thermoanaerobaculia bacterium]|nr:hypothetical protein [Thermoanaerobaculia bacterium]
AAARAAASRYPSWQGRPMSRRQALRRAVAAAASAALLSFGRVNTSASLPRGLYAEVPSAWMGRPGRGDLMVACAPPAAAELARRRAYLADGPCAAGAAGGAAPLGKVVLAVAGDEVMVASAGLGGCQGDRPLWDRLISEGCSHES